MSNRKLSKILRHLEDAFAQAVALEAEMEKQIRNQKVTYREVTPKPKAKKAKKAPVAKAKKAAKVEKAAAPTRYTLDTARRGRVPAWVLAMTGLKTKAEIVERYGNGFRFVEGATIAHGEAA